MARYKEQLAAFDARAKEQRAAIERAIIENVLIKHDGNVLAAARELELPHSTIWHRIKALGIDYESFRKPSA